MDLHLEFSAGIISGNGTDDVGPFTIRGGYDTASGECHWTKSYLGSHDVFYRGFREGKGIWGTWEIRIIDHGGFHIWPRTPETVEEKTGEDRNSSEQSEPMDAIGTTASYAQTEPLRKDGSGSICLSTSSTAPHTSSTT